MKRISATSRKNVEPSPLLRATLRPHFRARTARAAVRRIELNVTLVWSHLRAKDQLLAWLRTVIRDVVQSVERELTVLAQKKSRRNRAR